MKREIERRRRDAPHRSQPLGVPNEDHVSPSPRLAAVAVGPAYAAGKCAAGPKSEWQPKSALESQLQTEGFTVKQIKIESGCYEVYATDKGGKRVNMAYNAQTLEKLDNAEAGEN